MVINCACTWFLDNLKKLLYKENGGMPRFRVKQENLLLSDTHPKKYKPE